MFGFYCIVYTTKSKNYIMSKSAKCQVVSNRMRNIQRGSYTDIFQREAEAERKKKANMHIQIYRLGGGRKW